MPSTTVTARPPKRSFGAAPPHSAGAGNVTVDRLGAAVDRDDDGALRLRVAAQEDVAVALGDEPLVRPAPERGLGRCGSRRASRSRPGAPRRAGGPCPGRTSFVSPRHVAAVVGPVAARRGRPPRRSRSSGCRPSSSAGPPRAGRAPRSRRAGRARPGRRARRGSGRGGSRRGPSRATSGSGRRRPPGRAPRRTRGRSPGSAKSNPASISSRSNQGSRTCGSPPQTSPRRKKPLPTSSRVRLRCSFQKSWATCLTVSRRKPSTPSRFAQAICGVEEVLRDLGVLGLEVGEAGDARRDVVLRRSPPSRSSGTSPSSSGPSCTSTRSRRGCRRRRGGRGCRARGRRRRAP